MRILTNVPKVELNYLVHQPTAKAMIEKVKTEGIYIPKGDIQGAKDFVATRKSDYRIKELYDTKRYKLAQQTTQNYVNILRQKYSDINLLV